MPRKRRPTALPILPVPAGVDPTITAQEAAAQIGISESRFWSYAKRHALLVSGRRITEAVAGGRGCTRWIQSYVTAHIHQEMRRARDEDRSPAPAPQLLRQAKQVQGVA